MSKNTIDNIYVDDANNRNLNELINKEFVSRKKNPSKRTKRLLDAIDKCLVEAVRQIDTKETVTDCYGKDISLFGEGDGIDMLASLLDGNLERINENILADSCSIIKEQGIQKRLCELETTLKKHEKLEESQRQAEEDDITITRMIVDDHKIIDNITASHVLRYQEHRLLVDALNQLSKELLNIDNENEYYSLEMEKQVKCIKKISYSLDKKAECLLRMADSFHSENTLKK